MTSLFTSSIITGQRKKETMPNPVNHFQIMSKEPEVTAKFYSELFGWRVSDPLAMGYRNINTGTDEGIRGSIWPMPGGTPSFAQLFIAVDDVREAASKARKLGARLLIPAIKLPDGSEMSVLSDPQGMPFAIWKKPSDMAADKRR